MMRMSVAIKRLDKEDKESSKAFCRELMIAASLHHPNVVPLLGFCIDPDHGLFLVYKFVSGGSLDRHLHGSLSLSRLLSSFSLDPLWYMYELPIKFAEKKKKRGIKGSSTLGWSVRYKVAIGIAEAVAYLHNGTERCVVHRDIKPSNILLSSNKTPKV